MITPTLGCIADDLTGATDLANNLVRAGMRVVLTIDVPAADTRLDADAIVVALKTRSIPANDAVQQSIGACRWLRRQGVRQIYFKICSTFDSTPKGNIGPVIEGLMRELGSPQSVVVPAFPENGRTVYQGHMFIGSTLLSESSMRHHPLNPMTDSNLVRFLQTQLSTSQTVGLLDHTAVSDSSEAILKRIDGLRQQGVTVAMADTLTEADLHRLAVAVKEDSFVTASSGLGITLPVQWGFHPSAASSRLPAARGSSAILSGSCSAATNQQVEHFVRSGGAAGALDAARAVEDPEEHVNELLVWAEAQLEAHSHAPILIYSTVDPASVQSVHTRFGVEHSGAAVENALATLAKGLVAIGVGRLIIAGGETSGVCARAIGAGAMQIGPQIDPGVPWCYAATTASPLGAIHLALKSGNFGTVDFFSKAFSMLNAESESQLS